MEEIAKQQIADQLRKFCAKKASDNVASREIGISNAYVSQMLNGKFEGISDNAWRTVEKAVCVKGWVTVDTKASVLLINLFNDARTHSNVFGITGDPGIGKTHISRQYSSVTENVYFVRCNEYFNRKTFLAALLQSMGRDSGGYTVSEMMNTVVNYVRKAETPLLILDEADKLNDQVFYFIISLYNFLEGKSGIVIMATDHLEKRVRRGLSLNKKGYKEIYSRIGRKFINLAKPSAKDIRTLVVANGIDDENQINSIINDCENDLRRVERLVHSHKIRD